jgi:predicted restriction endonuclease
MCQPGPPFFHLRSSGFWHHRIIPGREAEYAALTTTSGDKKRILRNIEYAFLSDEAFQIIKDASARTIVRPFIMCLLGEEK